MLKFKSHTADIRLKASAETIPQLFLHCLKGMNELLKHGFCNESKETDLHNSIEIEAIDTTVLLIDFLSEVLTLSTVNQAVYCIFIITRMNDHQLAGELKGTRVEVFDSDIKAVTYHEADVHLNENGEYETVIIFDI